MARLYIFGTNSLSILVIISMVQCVKMKLMLKPLNTCLLPRLHHPASSHLTLCLSIDFVNWIFELVGLGFSSIFVRWIILRVSYVNISRKNNFGAL